MDLIGNLQSRKVGLMKAEQMFKRLGYSRVRIGTMVCYVSGGWKNSQVIMFNPDTKTFCARYNNDSKLITSDELMAINKQIEELRWNDTNIFVD